MPCRIWNLWVYTGRMYKSERKTLQFLSHYKNKLFCVQRAAWKITKHSHFSWALKKIPTNAFLKNAALWSRMQRGGRKKKRAAVDEREPGNRIWAEEIVTNAGARHILGGEGAGTFCMVTAQQRFTAFLMAQEPDCSQLSHHRLVCVFI